MFLAKSKVNVLALNTRTCDCIRLVKLLFPIYHHKLFEGYSKGSILMHRFTGNLDLCGQQVQKPCRTSLGFPAVLPRAESDEARGNNFL